MPSDSNPNSKVQPGPGRLPAGVLPPPSSNTQEAVDAVVEALDAHVNKTPDAHMAGAIGIPATYTPTGEVLLSSSGGLIDGESVLDLIARIKDTYPAPPNRLGFNDTTIPNTGEIEWDVLDYATEVPSSEAQTGGWTDAGGNVVLSKCLVPDGTLEAVPTMVLYPADRGLIALYHSDTGVFNDGSAVLIAALWLGPTSTRPAGLSSIDSADFHPGTTTSDQYNYTGNGSGLNLFKMTYRVPRLRKYAETIAAGHYEDYNSTFYGHQIAIVSVISGTMIWPQVSPSYGGGYLFMHFKETYPTVLADFNGASLGIGGAFSSNHLYSATLDSDFDGGGMATLNRRYIFTDTLSAVSPSFASADANTVVVASTYLSGVLTHSSALHFNSGGGMQAQVNDLFGNGGGVKKGYLTGTDVSANVLSGYTSLANLFEISFEEFGGSVLQVPYDGIQRAADATFFSLSNAPQPVDIAQYYATPSIPSPVAYTTPFTSISQVKFTVNSPFVDPVTAKSTSQFIFNSYARTGASTASTPTYEPFFDERHRYITLFEIPFDTSDLTQRLVPAGGNPYNSSTVLVADAVALIGDTGAKASLQVVGGQLVYPHTDFGAGTISPASQPDYSAVYAADKDTGSAHIRSYVRAFDTGRNSSLGRFRIVGTSLENFGNVGGYVANDAMIIELWVPGTTVWLDLGLAADKFGINLMGGESGCLLSVEHQYSLAGRATVNSGTLQGFGKTTAELLLYVEVGDTIFISAGASRGIYTVSDITGSVTDPILSLTPQVGTLVDGPGVPFEIYRGPKVLGSIYSYSTAVTDSGPTPGNVWGEYLIFMRITIRRSSADLGITEIEWLPL